jgi:hypothetical protein
MTLSITIRKHDIEYKRDSILNIVYAGSSVVVRIVAAPSKWSCSIFVISFQVYKPLLDRFKALEDKITFFD